MGAEDSSMYTARTRRCVGTSSASTACSANIRSCRCARPGFGDTDWTRVISELRLAGYTGTIDIEGWHDPVYRDDLEMTGQVRALNYLKQCRGGSASIANPA